MTARQVTSPTGKKYYIVEGENYSLAPIEGCPCFTKREWDWIRLRQLSKEELAWIYDTRLKDPDYEFIPEEDKESYADMYKKPESKISPTGQFALQNIKKLLGKHETPTPEEE